MKKLAIALAFLLMGFAASAAQNVTVIGPITPGDCPQFNSTTVIKDSGFNCAGTPTVAFANPTAVVGLTAVNGAATTAMRSDAAPPLSASVQSALTATINQVLIGTGAFGFSSVATVPIAQGGTGQATATLGFGALAPSPTRAGDVIYWNGSAWVTLAGNNSGSQILSENASGVPSWSSAGAGSVTSVTCGTGLSGGTFTTTGTCALANNSATLQANPSNPAACATATCPLATGAMMGLGTTCHLTPVFSTRVEVTFYNGVANSVSGNNNEVKVFFGTGTAPANAAAVTGTQIGNLQRLVNGGVNFIYALANGGIATGLTPGTAYWFDESLGTDGNTASLNNVSCSIREF
jgi:hypothetical protein